MTATILMTGHSIQDQFSLFPQYYESPPVTAASVTPYGSLTDPPSPSSCRASMDGRARGWWHWWRVPVAVADLGPSHGAVRGAHFRASRL